MTAVLYDLVGIDDRRFSPYCWRSRMALAHKGLQHQAQATKYGEIANIGAGQQKTLPVLQDGDNVVGDSWAIANYLEESYPDKPSLFGGESGRHLTIFIQSWANAVLNPGLISLVVLDVYNHLDPEDQPYFRQTREKRFGRPLEEVQAGREERLDSVQKSFEPVRLTLQEQPFIGGERPMYSDYIVFSGLQWVRTVSDFGILSNDDPVFDWFNRCLDLYNGLGRNNPGYY